MAVSKFFGDSLSGATFSPCRTWRYALWRRWNDSRDMDIGDIGDGSIGNIDRGPDFKRMVAFVGLNPSKADETENDPTIRRCIGFAKSWGYDGLAMLNLFAFRATDPDDMKRATDPVGPENDECLRQAQCAFGQVIAAWGTDGAFRSRHYVIRGFIAPSQMFHLGLTKGGHPRHPLYLKKDLHPVRWDV